jgi:hypothetical protein
VDVHPTTVVLNETHLPEPIHEETDSRTGGADHFGEGFLTHFCNERYRFRFLTKVGHQQEKPGEALFAGVEQVIHEVCLHANIPGKKVGKKSLGKLRLLVLKPTERPSAFIQNWQKGASVVFQGRSCLSLLNAVYALPAIVFNGLAARTESSSRLITDYRLQRLHGALNP